MTATSPLLSLQWVLVETGDADDRRGVLVFAGAALVAIFVRLEAPAHGHIRGMWFLEIGLGPLAGTPEPFATLPQALAWAGHRFARVGTESADLIGKVDLEALNQVAAGHDIWQRQASIAQA